MKLVKALLLVAAVGAVNFAYADGNTCQNNQNAPRGDTNEVKAQKWSSVVFPGEQKDKAGDSSASS